MRRAIGHTVRWGWFMIAAFVILAAVVLSMTRILAPFVADYVGAMEEMASRDFGTPVSIGEIDLRLRGLQIQLQLHDIILYSDDGTEVLQSLREAYIVPDWMESILHGTLRIRELIVDSGVIAILREEDGSLSLRGVEFGTDEDWIETLSHLLQSQPDILVGLRDSTVEWIDRLAGVRTEFRGVDVFGRRSEEIHQLSLVADLPPEVGTRISAVVHMHGTVANSRGWKGRIYAKVEDLNLAAPVLRGFGGQWARPSGVVSIEAWSDWDGGRPQQLTARVTAKDLSLGSAGEGARDGENEVLVSGINADLEWLARDKGGLLRGVARELRVGNKAWPRVQGAWSYTEEPSGESMHRGAIDYLDVHSLWTHVRSLPAIRENGWLTGLVPFVPSGSVSDVRLAMRGTDAGITGYQFSAGFERLGIGSSDDLPGISGLSGVVRGDDQGGQVVLGSRSILFDAPRLFSRGLWADQLSGTFLWRIGKGGVDISSEYFALANEDIIVNGQVRAALSTGAPYVDLHLFYRDGDGSHLGRYLPDRWMPTKVSDWLTSAIETAHIRHGELILQGNPLEFPFVDTAGVFKATAAIDKGVLKLTPSAPVLSDIRAQLELVNQGLRMRMERARWLDVQVAPVTVEIADLSRAKLKISAKAAGDLGQMISIEERLGLPGTGGGLDRYLRFKGPTRLDVNLEIPLAQEIREPVRVDGLLTLSRGSVEIVGQDQRIDRLKGTMRVDTTGVTATGIGGVWSGRPITLGARVATDGSQSVLLQGRLPLSQFSGDHDSPLFDHVRGEALWQAEISVPNLLDEHNRDPSIGISVRSDLAGITVDLPSPFGKSAGRTRGFRFEGRWSKGFQGPVRIDYGTASAVLLFSRRYGETFVPRAELCLNQGKAVLPRVGWRVRGSVNELSVDDWRPVYEALSKGGGKGGPTETDRLRDVDLWFRRFIAGGVELRDLSVKARKGTSYWRMQLDSPAITGKMTVPVKLDSGLPLTGTFSHIKVETGDEGGGRNEIDPRTLPAVSLTSEVFQYNDNRFQDVRLKTTKEPGGLRIHLIQMGGDGFSAHAVGTWRVLGRERQRTQLQGEIHSDDVGKALAAYRLQENVEGGRGSLNVDLSWPGSPLDFEFQGLKGHADLMVTKGRLTNVDAGAGRLIGLLNVGAVARRLSLDFSDVFKKGFSFDEVKGKFYVNGAEITTRKLEIKGPPAYIMVKGVTDVEKEEYDQIVTVVPEVGGGVAVAGTLVGGPLVGVTLLVADKILGHFNRGIGRLAAFKYHVTGSWENPVLTTVKASPPKDSFELEGEIE